MSTAVGLRDYLGRGHHDDGREGVVLTKSTLGDLVKVPFGIGGAGTIHNIGSGTASAQTNIATNPDGSGTALNVSVPNGLTQGTAYTEVVYGPTVGVRIRRNNSATLPPNVALIVNGVSRSLRNVKLRYDGVVSSATDSEALFVVDEDLGPGPHTVKLVVPSDPYGGTTRAILFYGWLLARSAGYKDPPKWGPLGSAAFLSTSTTALSATSVYRKILLYNTDTVARFVTMKAGSTILKRVDLAAAGAAGDSAEIDFSVPILGVSSVTLQADVASKVTWLPIFAEAR